MNNITDDSADRRAQSAVIGVTLLAGLVVISAGTVGLLTFTNFSDQTLSDPQFASCEITHQSEVTVTHRGGQTIETAELTVEIKNGSGVTRVPFTNGHTDDYFKVGEIATFGTVDQRSSIKILSPDTVICEGSVTPGPTSGDSPPTVAIQNVQDTSQCSAPTPNGKCKGKARTNLAEFDVTWSASADRGLRDVRVELVDRSGTIADTAIPSVSGTSADGTVTLRDEGGYGHEYTIELTVTDTANRTATENTTTIADGRN